MPIEERRDPITPEALAALPYHPGWRDGRTDAPWARFDASVTPEGDLRHLHAELSWGNDGEDGGTVDHFSPELWFETRRPHPRHGHLVFVDGTMVPLSQAEAAAILQADPRELLTTYAETIKKLRVATSA